MWYCDHVNTWWIWISMWMIRWINRSLYLKNSHLGYLNSHMNSFVHEFRCGFWNHEYESQMIWYKGWIQMYEFIIIISPQFIDQIFVMTWIQRIQYCKSRGIQYYEFIILNFVVKHGIWLCCYEFITHISVMNSFMNLIFINNVQCTNLEHAMMIRFRCF